MSDLIQQLPLFRNSRDSKWESAAFADLYSFQNGVNADKSAYGRGIPFVNVLEVIKNSHLDARKITGRVSLNRNQIECYMLRSGDLLFNRTSETQEEVGLAAVYLDSAPAVFGGFVIRGRPKNGRLLGKYAGYALRALSVREQIVALGQGAVRANIGQGDLRKVEIAVPPLAEQEAIANALSDADAYIESLEKLIEKKRAIKKGAMQELLTGKPDWRHSNLWDLCGQRKELFDDGDWIEAEHITSSGIRLIQTGNIGEGEFLDRSEKKCIFEKSFHALRCKSLRAGDILICRLAEPAGRACILPELEENKVITSVDVTICRPDQTKVDRRFLVQLFSTANWLGMVSERSGGTTHKRIARGALGRLSFAIPSMVEQRKIADILCDMDQSIFQLGAKLAKARLLKQGMMQELLTGRIRLV